MTRYAALLLLSASGLAQTDWPSYGNDPGAMRYSSLRQIDTGNVAQLKLGWTFRTGKPGSEAVPIVVDGAMYVTGPDGVYALVPETGELLWKYAAAPVALRGLAYWPGAGSAHPRVFAGNGFFLLALDVTTGKPAPGFGNEGRVDLKKGVLGDLPDGRYDLQSPPAVFGDVVITGCSNGEGSPSAGAYGDIRGWDARTGKLLWTFHTVARPGEPGSETWPAGGWKNRSGTNVWGFFTIDVKRGIVYAPLGSPTSDFYGADRVGDGLYGNSLVALDARTGAMKWRQQLVHHDLWDYDLAAPPALFDIRRDGRVIPAVAEITKMGLLFVFDRVTGEPVYGIEERPVPQTAVPGEATSKTQPFPVKPSPLARNTFRPEDMYDRSPEHARFCRELFETNRMQIGAPYTPLPLEGNALFFPSTLGGGNWGGVSIDPSLGLLFVNVMNVGQWGHLEKRGSDYARTSAYGPYARFWDRETRIPCQNPPFGELIAVDLASGDIAWRSVLGRIEALEAIGVHDTGSLNLGGSISTAGGLVFIGATNDSRFRAFDSRTGKLLWEAKLEASGHSSPITYMGRDQRQYVALMAAGGGGFLGGGLSDSLVAFALPNVYRKPLPVSVSKAVAAAAVAIRGTPGAGAFSPAALPAGGAKALVEKTCGTGCHSTEVVTTQRMTATEWNSVVRNMVARGAHASDDEVKLIVEYLAKTLGREGVSAPPAQQPAQDPLLRWMDQIAQQQLQKRENVIAGIHTVAGAERRKAWVRQTLLSVIGGLPEYNGPLNPRITGRLQSDGYAIEKVIFESLPGFYVTANLYLPSQPGRYPGVLLQAGHTQEGKPEGQRLAANLALKGFVTLAFDPLGQGEREQTYDRQVDRPLAGWSVPEHIQAGAQNILIGQSVARYFIWDAKRALDYLVTRPEVDPERLGAVGCSGGGALTTFIGALDPRVKAVAPACFVNSYRLLFAGQNPDSEMSPPQLLSSGLDMADYIELSAPTPWLILATEGDYFTPAGARLVYEEARRWFGLYGASDKLRFFVGPGPHGTPLETREAMYEWMIRWLKDGKGDFHEQAVKLYTNAELLVTASGHVDNEPGSRKLYQLISDEFRARKRPGSIPELLAELRRLNTPSAGAPPEVRASDEADGPELRRQHISFESEPGVEISGKLYIPHSSGRKPAVLPAVLLVADKTSSYWIASTDSLAETIARTGRVVLELEPRDSPGEGERPYVGNWLTNARADQIGRNLPAMRAHDILRGIDVLAARSDVDPSSIRAVARGVKGIWLLLAAAVDTRIGKVWLDRTPYSLRTALENSMNTGLFDAVIPSFALHWDLDDLTKAMENRPVLWTDPTNWMGHVVPLGSLFRYRTVLGDATDLHDAEDHAFIEDLIR